MLRKQNVAQREMRDLKREIKKIPYLRRLKKIAELYRINIYLVGGFLRDFFLKSSLEARDFDFALNRNVFSLARKFSAAIGGSFVVLDRKIKKNARVVKKYKGRILHYDFSLLRAKDIAEDLKQRDFTINSLGLDIKDFREMKLLGDEQAFIDLKKKTLRLSYKDALLDDPLRILRAFSLAALYGFKLAPSLLKEIYRQRQLLSKVAGERISEELFKIFSSESAGRLAIKMDKVFIWDELFPQVKLCRGLKQGPYHHLDVWAHSLETLRQLEKLLRHNFFQRGEALGYLSYEISPRHTRRQLIKLACLLHDLGKPQAKRKRRGKLIFWEHEKIGRDFACQISQRLKLSKREESFLANLVYFHLRPGYLTDNLSLSPRAVFRFFRAAKEDSPAVILLSLADLDATRGPLIDKRRRRRQRKLFFSLWEKYWESKRKNTLPRLVNGFDIMRGTGINPSPLVGEILRKIEEEQALGNIKTASQALNLAKKLVKQLRK